MWVIKYQGQSATYYCNGTYNSAWWTTILVEALKFQTREEAESEALLYSLERPDYIGHLEVVPVRLNTTPYGNFWEEPSDAAHAIH